MVPRYTAVLTIHGRCVFEQQNVTAWAKVACVCSYASLDTKAPNMFVSLALISSRVFVCSLQFALWGCITMFFWFQTFILNAAVFALFLSLAILFFLLAACETNPGIVMVITPCCCRSS